MVGRRVIPNPEEYQYGMESGDYGKDSDGLWFVRTPNGLVGCIQKHTITEHEDGTITVSPSILVGCKDLGTWHGYLEKGIWRSV